MRDGLVGHSFEDEIISIDEYQEIYEDRFDDWNDSDDKLSSLIDSSEDWWENKEDL